MLPEDKWLKANGIKLHYLDWGNPAAAPMVLLHGFTSYAHYWDFFARNFKSEYHVLALDSRGHGDSGCAISYTMQDGVLDLAEFITILNLENIVLVGLSMGGLISILYTATYHNIVSKLMVVDVGPEFASAGIEHIQRDLAHEPEFFNSEDEAAQYLKQVQPLHSETFLKHQANYALKRDKDGRLVFKYDKTLCRIELESPQWLWDYLEQIKCPTLVIHATDSDMLLKETAQKMVAKLPQGSLVEVDHATHNIVGDNPQGFEAAVRRFLGARG